MYVSAWPFEAASQLPSAQRQRAVGRVAFSAVALDGRTRPMRIEESGSMRIRLPRGEGNGIDAVLVNTAGGIACGDRFAVAIEAQAGASVTVATPAAEKVYRSDGPVCGADGQPDASGHRLGSTGCRRKRSCSTGRGSSGGSMRALPRDGAPDPVRSVVFGREARAEQIDDGLFEDRWRIRRGGRLVYADTLRLDGPIADLLQKPSVGNGARAVATLIHVAPDAEARLESVRDHLPSGRRLRRGRERLERASRRALLR